MCPTSRATATNWARTCASSPTLSVTVVASRIKAPWVRISRNLWTQIVRFHRVPIQVSPRGPQFRFCAFKWGLHKFFQGEEVGIYSTTHAVNMEMRSNIHFFSRFGPYLSVPNALRPKLLQNLPQRTSILMVYFQGNYAPRSPFTFSTRKSFISGCYYRFGKGIRINSSNSS